MTAINTSWTTPHALPDCEGPVRVAIVDDQILFAESLAAYLRSELPTVVSVYSGRDPLMALNSTAELVLLDIDLGRGTQPVGQLVETFIGGGAAVILLSAQESGVRLREALLAGAVGCIGKSSDPGELIRTIEGVMDGDHALTRELAEIMCAPGPPQLSPQELRALRLYCTGFPLKSVARQMGVGTSTAKEYLDRVRSKYDAVGRTARTKTELAHAARLDGLLDE